MLAALARWLRVLGFDTGYDPLLADPELLALADREGRIVLSRDRQLMTRLPPPRGVLVTEDKALDQLRQVVAACRLDLDRELFTRCLVCNARLEPLDADGIGTRIPEQARALPGPFRRCPGCERLYWPGSHVRRMRAALERTFPGGFGGDRQDTRS